MRLIYLLFAALTLHAQDREAGITKLSATDRLFVIDAYRPLDVVAQTFAEAYAIDVNAEDPQFLCSSDVNGWIPKGAAFQLRYSVNAKRMPVDVPALLRQAVDTNNQRASVKYRLRVDGDVYTFIPASARDIHCQLAPLKPLLDTRVSVPRENRSIAQHLMMLRRALIAASGRDAGFSIQSWINYASQSRVIWEAHDEPARDSLLRLIQSTGYRIYWLAREAPGSGCVINLMPMTIVTIRNGLTTEWITSPGRRPIPPSVR